MPRATSRFPILGAFATALLVPATLLAQQPPDHDHGDPAAAPNAAAPGMMEGMAARMQSMQEMMHQMHQMMMSMHGGEQGHGMQGQGMAMGGRGMGGGMAMGAAGAQPCSAPEDVRLSMLLAGSVGQLALTSAQWNDLVAILEHARTEALAKLTQEQREQLSTCR